MNLVHFFSLILNVLCWFIKSSVFFEKTTIALKVKATINSILYKDLLNESIDADINQYVAIGMIDIIKMDIIKFPKSEFLGRIF